eukprot:212107-Pleurochrysis_carterae.AAC.3
MEKRGKIRKLEKDWLAFPSEWTTRLVSAEGLLTRLGLPFLGRKQLARGHCRAAPLLRRWRRLERSGVCNWRFVKDNGLRFTLRRSTRCDGLERGEG